MANGLPGAPLGNSNAVKNRVVEQYLRKAALEDNAYRLKQGCKKLMQAFEAGEPWALHLVFDRLDGKAIQQLEATDNTGRSLAIALISFSGEEVRSGYPLQLPAKEVSASIPESDGSGEDQSSPGVAQT